MLFYIAKVEITIYHLINIAKYFLLSRILVKKIANCVITLIY